MRKLVSVIVPCHNRGPLLPLTLASLKAQSISQKDYEVLLVDDGSTSAGISAARIAAGLRRGTTASARLAAMC